MESSTETVNSIHALNNISESPVFPDIREPNFLHQYLLDPAPVPYEQRPKVINLDESWQSILRDMVSRSDKDGLEWGYSHAKVVKGDEAKLETLGPYPGTKEALTDLLAKKDASSGQYTIALSHNHPNQGPLSIGDLFALALIPP